MTPTQPPAHDDLRARLQELLELSAKATPGPWVTDDTLPGRIYSDDATGSIIANFDGFQFAPRYDGEMSANVQLAKAAANFIREHGERLAAMSMPASEAAGRAVIARMLVLMVERGCSQEAQHHVCTLAGMATVPQNIHPRDAAEAIAYFTTPHPAPAMPVDALREAVADYMYSEGCSCCQDKDAHETHTKRLAELLGVPLYGDGSGYDFCRFRSKP